MPLNEPGLASDASFDAAVGNPASAAAGSIHAPEACDDGPASVTGPRLPLTASDLLLELITAFLAPMFLSASIGDLWLARLAALETIASYGARSQADLMNIAQTIGFGLAVMDNLLLSFTPDIALTMKIRLRGGANGLNRSARQNQQDVDKRRQDNPPPQPLEAPPVGTMGDPMPFDKHEVSDAQVEATIEHAQSMVSEAHARMRTADRLAQQTVALQASTATTGQPLVVQSSAAELITTQSIAAQSATAELITARPVGAELVRAQSFDNEPAAVRSVASEPRASTTQPGIDPSIAANPIAVRPIGAVPVPAQPVAAQPIPAFPFASTATAAGLPAALAQYAGVDPNEQQSKLMWASAMTKVAGELDSEDCIPQLRKANKTWASVLGSHASYLAMSAAGISQPDKPPAPAATKAPKRR